MSRSLAAAAAFASVLTAGASAVAQNIQLQTNAGGVPISGARPSWSTGFGSVNGLGVMPGPNLTALTRSGGVLYTTPYDIRITGTGGGNPAVVRAYVSTNFAHPSILQVYSCASNCTAAANYTALSTNSGSPSDIIGPPGLLNQTVTRSLAVFVSNQNGAAAFAGSDSARLTLLVYNGANNSLRRTYTLALNNPNENMQTALRLVLAAAAGGRTISVGSDFALAFGTVNGLGINPGAGLTRTAVAGGQLYSTPYLLQPSFAGFLSTTGTVRAYVSTDFGHPSQLELRDSGNGSAFSAISKASGAQTGLAAATSGSTVTRYLGLFVSSANGATVFSGNDNATVTFTLVVP